MIIELGDANDSEVTEVTSAAIAEPGNYTPVIIIINQPFLKFSNQTHQAPSNTQPLLT
jgi:hypothetical protein